MRAKIQKSMVIILTLTLVISFFLVSGIVYRQSFLILKQDVKQEAEYISAGVEAFGEDYLDSLNTIQDDSTRITLIQKDGSVVFDSKEKVDSLNNHGNRKEVREAREKGIGEDTRMSDTASREFYYYAVELSNGYVLRVARSMNSLVRTAIGLFPVMVVLACLLILFAVLLARRQTYRLIRPINELDIDHPLDHIPYEELRPLLTAMDVRNKEKEAAADMRKEFSANVSHELKTPLTSISGYAEIMMNGLVKPEDIPQFSERIYKEAKRLISLVEDIIKLSKLDEESVELEKEEVDLYSLCREIVSRLSLQASSRNVHVIVQGEPVTYRGIRQILDEMIYNLCENAIKYNVDGGRVVVWAGNTLQGPKVTVADNGIGIPKEHLDRIFERFYRVDKSHSKETGGTGLGLSIVKHGALLHGARVTVESNVGEGTRIELQFPEQVKKEDARQA